MKIIKWKIGDTQPHTEGQLAVAIGNFDGIHQGHVKLLNECKKKKIRIIEDAAEGLSTFYKKKYLNNKFLNIINTENVVSISVRQNRFSERIKIITP